LNANQPIAPQHARRDVVTLAVVALAWLGACFSLALLTVPWWPHP